MSARRFTALLGWEGWVLVDSALPGQCQPRTDWEAGGIAAYFPAAAYGGWQRAKAAAEAAAKQHN